MSERVYLRDATDVPNSRILYHFLRDDGLSACGRAVLIEDSCESADSVSDGYRCRASGCRQKWPQAEKEVP